MLKKQQVKFAIPKGSLQFDTLELLKKAGYQIEGYEPDSRNYRPAINDSEIVLKVLRPQEIPMYVEDGLYDIGITGFDWLLEADHNYRNRLPNESGIQDILDLKYGLAQIILAIPKAQSDVSSFANLCDFHRGTIRIATEYLNLSSSYIIKMMDVEPSIISPWRRPRRLHASQISLILSFGATEGKPPEDAEAIIDLASSEMHTIKANGLKVIDFILPALGFSRYSTARLVANKDSLEDPSKGEKIRQIRDKFAIILEEKK